MNNISYLLALHSINGLGPIRLKKVLEYFKDPKLVWETSDKELSGIGIPKNTVELLLQTRKTLDPEKYAESIKNSGIKWLTVYDENYPKLLSQIYDPPVILYYKGEILPEDQNALAVVGTRKITGYGTVVTRQFTTALVNAHFTIVSGLARGVDSIAHEQTVKDSGRTLAILGGGLNHIFPPENRGLAEKIASGFGAVISEFPPDYPSLPGNFPSRNRIIAGLSKAVVVTEAASDSGSLITARLAVESGREVFAVPGPITSSLSKGPIELIREGAKAVFDPQEILEELGVGKVIGNRLPFDSAQGKQVTVNLTENEKKIIEVLENENKHIDEICRELNLNSAIVSASLLKMEISGLVSNLGSGIYCKI